MHGTLKLHYLQVNSEHQQASHLSLWQYTSSYTFYGQFRSCGSRRGTPKSSIMSPSFFTSLSWSHPGGQWGLPSLPLGLPSCGTTTACCPSLRMSLQRESLQILRPLTCSKDFTNVQCCPASARSTVPQLSRTRSGYTYANIYDYTEMCIQEGQGDDTPVEQQQWLLRVSSAALITGHSCMLTCES